MKLPKETKRYCPYCRERTSQSISVAKQKSRSATHPMSRGSTPRLKMRGLRSGLGSKGKYSKPAVKNWKRKTKATKRLTVMYTCKKCKKAKMANSAIRTSRLEIGEKVAK